MNSKEFSNELKHLTELGYLEQAQLDRIQDEYMGTRRENRSIFLIFALLGVFFIGAGVISLFAFNWSMFSREMKALIAFLPLMGVQGILYWKIRTQASEVWIKSLTLALGIAFLSALGLIYQAYQLSFSVQSMMLTGFLIMLPIIYLLDGYYLAILYLAGICWAGWGSDYTLLVILLYPYYIKRVRSGLSCWQLSLCFFVWQLYLTILYVPSYAYYACLLILLFYMCIDKPAIYQKLAGRILYIMLFFKAVLYMVFNLFTDLLLFGESDFYFHFFPEFVLLALISGVLVRMYFYLKKKSKGVRIDILLSGVICCLLAVDLILFQDDFVFAYEVLVNICFIAFSLYKLLCGVKAADLGSVRRYIAAIIFYIVIKVFFGAYHLLVKGIVFIIAGISFLVVNYMLTLKLKGVKTGEDKQK